ncbi:MAG: addiction module protein [Desulfobacterales bacterium]|nr:addiction module protein [Desulfobacterales bacterium]
MSVQLKEIEEKALLLPPAEREILAERLLYSLDSEYLADIEDAWIQEAERRYQEFQNDKSRGIPGDEVFHNIRREMGWQKS